MGGSFKEDDKPPTKERVVRKPSFIKMVKLDFQGNSQVEQKKFGIFKKSRLCLIKKETILFKKTGFVRILYETKKGTPLLKGNPAP